jgi:hypothetical protein
MQLSDRDDASPREASLLVIIALTAAGIAAAVAITTGLAAMTASRAHAAPTMSCLPTSIQAALARANAACGITVISTLRRRATIKGTGGSPSMHRWCRAADFTSLQPSCVLATLSDWPGALSIDYAAVRHTHIDDGHYSRFRHNEHRRHRRHARRS